MERRDAQHRKEERNKKHGRDGGRQERCFHWLSSFLRD
jgi:hypothetical protein